jgi:hypothetical protein
MTFSVLCQICDGLSCDQPHIVKEADGAASALAFGLEWQQSIGRFSQKDFEALIWSR